jgi:hypothetical protein
MKPITGIACCCARATTGHDGHRAADKRDELATLQLTELHPLPQTMARQG